EASLTPTPRGARRLLLPYSFQVRLGRLVAEAAPARLLHGLRDEELRRVQVATEPVDVPQAVLRGGVVRLDAERGVEEPLRLPLSAHVARLGGGLRPEEYEVRARRERLLQLVYQRVAAAQLVSVEPGLN